MLTFIIAALLPVGATATAQVVPPGDWEIKSTVVSLAVPGLPGFIQRMAKGRTKAERKRLTADQGVEALLAPDPKAGCRLDSQHVAQGRYEQMLTCPQKKGEPIQVARTGTYDGSGFAGRATVTGSTPKGAMSIVLDQRGVRVAAR